MQQSDLFGLQDGTVCKVLWDSYLRPLAVSSACAGGEMSPASPESLSRPIWHHTRKKKKTRKK